MMIHKQHNRDHMMTFRQNLANLRKEVGVTQKTLAEKSGVSLQQLKNYEAGRSQPTLDVIKRLSIALNANSDQLVFDPEERDPENNTLRLQLAAIAKFPRDEQETVISFLDAFIKRRQMEEVITPNLA